MSLDQMTTANRLATNPGTGSTTMSGWQPIDDWSTLTGCLVEIHHRGQLVDLGTVDCVTHDGNLLWLQQNGANSRRIIEKSPDVYVRLTQPLPSRGGNELQCDPYAPGEEQDNHFKD